MASSDSQPTSLLLQLPPELLKRIMSNLNHQERLCSCSLVCQQLNHAAAAATDALVMWRKQQAAPAPMTQAAAYLRRHGDFLTRLEVEGWGEPLDWLPCRNLRHLDISSGVTDGVLWLAPMRDALSSCTGLTHLGLQYVRFGCTEDAEVFAAHMTGLRELTVKGYSPLEQQPYFGPDELPPFTRLTSLEWNVPHMTDDSLRHLSSLTGLRKLRIGQGVGSRDHPVTSAAFAGVTCLQQLQSLSLDVCVIDARAAPFFKSLTALQSLQLAHVEQVDVAVLEGLTQLTELVCVEEFAHEAAESLLALLPKLQQLRLLAFRSLVSTFEQFPAASFTALTASNNLQQLVLDFVEMPRGAWQHMFPSSKRMPKLTHVRIEGLAELGEPASWAPPLSTAGLAGLGSCCPGLRRIELSLIPWEEGLRLTALQPLSALTELVVAMDVDVNMAAVVQDIATLTQLVDLHLEGVAAPMLDLERPSLHVSDLTALQQLTRLFYVQHFVVEEFWDNYALLWQNKVARVCSRLSEPMSEECSTDGSDAA